jgi:hypothetical protein
VRRFTQDKYGLLRKPLRFHAVAALEVVREENLSENAERLGIILRKD